MEGSKELNEIFEAIEKWRMKHKGNCQFVGSFCAFKGKDFQVIDDRIISYGVKESLKIGLEELTKSINEEKEDFVCW